LTTDVSDPHPFHADPDPGFEIFADVDPDPRCEKFADPDPRLQFHQRMSALLRPKSNKRTWDPDQNVDPDPDPGTQKNADPDPGTPKCGSNADPDWHPKPWL